MANNKKNSNYVTEKTMVTKENARKSKTNKKVKEIVKQVLLITLAVVLIAGVLCGCWFGLKSLSKAPEIEYIDPALGDFEVTHTVKITIKNRGDIEIDLFGKEAPKTVKHLVEIFDSFVDTEIYIDGNGYPNFYNENQQVIDGEFYINDYDDTNNISHVAGVLTMDKKSKYQTLLSSFTILLDDQPSMNGQYAAVGYVKEPAQRKLLKDMLNAYSASELLNAPELPFGTNDISITAGNLLEKDKIIDRTFTPTTTATYKFKADKFTSFEIKLGDQVLSVASGESLKDGIEYNLEANKEYKIAIGIDGLEIEKYPFTVSSKIVTVGSDKVIEFDTLPGSIAYKFTAETSGEYKFVLNSKLTKLVIKDGETEKTATTGSNLKDGLVYTLEAGKEYTVILAKDTTKVEDYTKDITEGKFTFTKVEEDDKTAEKDENGEYPKKTYTKVTFPEIKRTITYKFTAPTTTKYIFDSIDKKLSEIVVFDGETVIDLAKTELEEGKTYDVYLVTKEVTSDTQKLTVLEKTLNKGTTTTDVQFGSVPKSIAYEFTPTETGKYMLALDNALFTKLVVKNGTETVEGSGSTLKDGFMFDLVANTKYTIIIAHSSEAVENYTTTITKSNFTHAKVEEEDKTAEKDENGNYPKKTYNKVTLTANRYATYKFVAESTSTYIFKNTDGKIKSFVLYDIDNRVAEGKNILDGAQYKLVAGTTYFVEMLTTDTEKNSCAVSAIERTLYVGSNSISAIRKENEAVQTEKDENNKEVKFVEVSYDFKPEKSGTYNLKTEQKYKVLDENKTELGTDNVYFVEGEIYTFVIRVEDDQKAKAVDFTIGAPEALYGENKIVVTKGEAAKDKDGKVITEGNPSRNKVDKFFTATQDGEHLIVTDSTEFTIKIYDENGDVCAELKEGTTSTIAELEKDKEYKIELKAVIDFVEKSNLEFTIYGNKLNYGQNTVVLAKDVKEMTYTFVAGATRHYSFKAQTEQPNNKGNLTWKDTEDVKIVVIDKDNKEIDAEYADLVMGETYTIMVTRETADAQLDLRINVSRALLVVEKVEVVEK